MKKILSFLMCLTLTFCSLNVFAYKEEADNLAEKYVNEMVLSPIFGSVGGEWGILALSRGDYGISSEYFAKYYSNFEKHIKSVNGVLDTRKYTEYSRTILALTAIGANVENVGGYNLLLPLSDYEKTIYQGISGSIWALIALDSKNYEIPQNPDVKTQGTRELYINNILERQNTDGGWALNKNAEKSDVDVTAMALQALSKYQHIADVKTAVEKGISYLSMSQNENGGFSGSGMETAEGNAQVIIAMGELGISLDDSRFIKNGKNALDGLMAFYIEGEGFSHTNDNKIFNLMATEQGMCALSAAGRMGKNKNSFYNMNDCLEISLDSKENESINVPKVIYDSCPLNDISGKDYEVAVGELYKRGIIKGKTAEIFDGEGEITRAELGAIIVRGLGLIRKGENNFKDVKESDWFYESVNSAYESGIIKGVGENEFNPYGLLTKEEGAVMLSRCIPLCSLEEFSGNPVDILSGFMDYKTISPWAEKGVATCYYSGILNMEDMEIFPRKNATRGEVAQMLYNLLKEANKL